MMYSPASHWQESSLWSGSMRGQTTCRWSEGETQSKYSYSFESGVRRKMVIARSEYSLGEPWARVSGWWAMTKHMEAVLSLSLYWAAAKMRFFLGSVKLQRRRYSCQGSLECGTWGRQTERFLKRATNSSKGIQKEPSFSLKLRVSGSRRRLSATFLRTPSSFQRGSLSQKSPCHSSRQGFRSWTRPAPSSKGEWMIEMSE
mmetsp:Transcript_7742/g.23614  ORF Transcript_7742/g.23614 Transcript_7742/m.23614 type:complete len:201 (-) Transcript_7742:1349-1951(-)